MRIFFKYTLFYSTIIPSEGNQLGSRQCCHKKIKQKKTNAVVFQFHKEHSLILDLVTHDSYALIWMHKKKKRKYGFCGVAATKSPASSFLVQSLICSPFTSSPGCRQPRAAVATAYYPNLNVHWWYYHRATGLRCFPPLHRKNVHLKVI